MRAHAIELRELCKSFDGAAVVDGISFDVPRGTVLGLLGPNGAGKTTTVHLLSTLLTPDGGSATVEGHDLVRDPAGVRMCPS